jgi:hypothetical protein
MHNLVFTVKEAIEFSNKGAIEEWVHSFLTTVGDNQALSDGLKLEKRYWVGPILIKLDRLKRCMGPEQYMEFVDSVENWEKHIQKFQKLVKDRWDMPPLIVQNINGELSVRDGNHRLEALRREGYDEFWVIIWHSEKQDDLKTLQK